MEQKALVALLESGKQHILLIDVRSRKDYDQGHIDQAIHLNVPLMHLRRSCPIPALDQSIKDWGLYAKIVIYGALSHCAACRALYKKLCPWHSQIFMLDCGYMEFSANYPMWCHSSHNPSESSPSLLMLPNDERIHEYHQLEFEEKNQSLFTNASVAKEHSKENRFSDILPCKAFS
jgi:rhodanese-related sulfurtransferase